MASNDLGVYHPLGTDEFAPHTDMEALADSLEGRVFVPVANVTDRASKASALSPSASEPLLVWRQDAPTGKNLEWTIDGISWRPMVPQLSGRVAVTNTGLVNPDAALTAVVTVPALAVPYRVIVTAMGKSGNAASARLVAWGFDSHAAGVTVSADPADRVQAATGAYATVVTTEQILVPAGTDCTFRLMYRGDNNGFNSGALRWERDLP